MECPIVKLDDKQNVIERIDGDEDATLPATEERREMSLRERLEEHVAQLREHGDEQKAETIETALQEVSD